MRLKRIFAALTAAVLLLTCAACGEEPVVPTGNTKEVTLEPGDVFACITVKDYGDITVKLFPDIAPNAVAKFIELAKRGYYDGRSIHRVIKDSIIQGGSLNGDGTDGTVEENEYIPLETSPVARHFYGALCFAPSSKGNYCQFYVVSSQKKFDISDTASKLRTQLADTTISARLNADNLAKITAYCDTLEAEPDTVKEKYKDIGGEYQLDGTATVFGQTVQGYDVIEKIANVEVVSGNQIDDANNVDSKPSEAVIIEKVEIVEIPIPETTTTTTEETTKKKKKKTTAEETSGPDETSVTEYTTEDFTSDTSDSTSRMSNVNGVSADDTDPNSVNTAETVATAVTTVPITAALTQVYTTAAPIYTTAAPVWTTTTTVVTTTEETTTTPEETTTEETTTPEETTTTEATTTTTAETTTTAPVTTTTAKTTATAKTNANEVEIEPDDEVITNSTEAEEELTVD